MSGFHKTSPCRGRISSASMSAGSPARMRPPHEASSMMMPSQVPRPPRSTPVPRSADHAALRRMLRRSRFPQCRQLVVLREIHRRRGRRMASCCCACRAYRNWRRASMVLRWRESVSRSMRRLERCTDRCLLGSPVPAVPRRWR